MRNTFGKIMEMEVYGTLQDLYSGFSLRILVAGERCNFTGKYFERGSTSEYEIVIGYGMLAELCVANRILPSPMPHKHLVY